MSEDSTEKSIPPALAGQGPKAAFLVLLKSDTALGVGQLIRLTQMDFILGRDEAADLTVVNESISRQHARIVQGPSGEFLIEDLGSTNGTFVNGTRISRQPLQDGDKIQLGSGALVMFSLRDQLDERFQRELYDAATRDGLTGLLSKSLFLATLEQEAAHSARRATPLSIAMIDIDHFKRVNDTLGHPVGDLALKWTATQLGSPLGPGDILARYGGEEFAALFRGSRLPAATALAERLRTSVESNSLKLPDGSLLKLTVSLGVATIGKGGASANELILAADAELYKAKQAGRNQVCARSVP